MPAPERARPLQPLPEQPSSTDPAVLEAQKDLAIGIQMLTRDWDRLVDNFGYCAGLLADAPDAPERIRGMMEFALAYHQRGLEVTTDAIEKTSGVPVKIAMLQKPEQKRPGETEGFRGERPPVYRDGRIVSIVGAESLHGREQERRLHAIAVMENRLGQALFVPVSLYPTGSVVIRPEIYYPDFQERYNTPKKMIEGLFPPTGRASGNDDGGRKSPESNRSSFHGERGGGRFRG